MTHDELLAAIGAALGDSEPYREQIGERDEVIVLGNGTSPPISRSREVLGGAIGPDGRVGWIEQRSEPPIDGYVHVEIDVRVVDRGRLHVSQLETYNPYFGCSVRLATWVADGFVFVYSEKHKTILSRFAAPYAEQQLVALYADPTMVGERLMHLDRYQGILRVRRLADLRPGIAVLTPLARSNPHSQELRLEADDSLLVATLPDREQIPGFERMDWAEVYPTRQRLATCRTIPLPPDEPLPPAKQLRKRWLRLLRGTPEAALVVDTIGEPWLRPAKTTSGYGFDFGGFKSAGERLAKPVRQALPKSERIYGWPSEGSFEERLDRIFLSAVGRAAL